MKIELSPAQVELLKEVIAEEAIRVKQATNLQYKGQFIASLNAILKKLNAKVDG